MDREFKTDLSLYGQRRQATVASQRHTDIMWYMVEYILNNIIPYVNEEEGIDYYLHDDRTYETASFLPQMTLS